MTGLSRILLKIDHLAFTLSKKKTSKQNVAYTHFADFGSVCSPHKTIFRSDDGLTCPYQEGDGVGGTKNAIILFLKHGFLHF